MGLSVIHASKTISDKWVIGVDTDQSGTSDTVITSSMKMLANAVNRAIEAHFSGSFPGGQSTIMKADTDGIGLALETSRFRSFQKADYDKIYDIISNNRNNVASEIITDMSIAAIALPCEYVNVY